jgi:hypothetical protein
MRTPMILFLLFSAGLPASARTVADAEFGFHVSNDPLDAVGDRYRVSVRHCRALEEAVGVLRDRHGWLVSVEVPGVVWTPDIETVVRETTGDAEGQCPRTVDFAVDYSSTDPMVAVQAVVDAYNAASPPFTAQVSWCGGNLCVSPDQVKDGSGADVGASTLLATEATWVGANRGDVLAEIVQQLELETGLPMGLSTPSQLDALLAESVDLAPGGDRSATDVLAEFAGVYNQQAFDVAWSRSQQANARDVALQGLSKIHGQFIGSAHRQGLSEAEADAQWEELREKLEAQIPEDQDTAPAFTPGVGPGLTWSLSPHYGQTGVTKWFLIFTPTLDPALIARFRPLSSTVPAPGDDADGDGVSDPVDQCADSPPGELVLWTGCTARQTCPCDAAWTNNGEYNGCVRDAVNTLVDFGTLEKNQKGQYTNSTKESGCVN